MMFWQRVVTIGIAAVTNFLTRYLPFRLFTSSKDEEDELSPFIKGLGEFLPAAIMSMLVVYCYRNINLLGGQSRLAGPNRRPDHRPGAPLAAEHVSLTDCRDGFLHSIN